MEFLLLKHAKNNNSKSLQSFLPDKTLNQNKEQKQSLILPKIQIETVLTDAKITSFEKIYLVKPTRSSITLTLSRPQENTFCILKDISGSKKHSIVILTEDNDLLIDDVNKIELDEPYESLSLLFNKDENKFFIY